MLFRHMFRSSFFALPAILALLVAPIESTADLVVDLTYVGDPGNPPNYGVPYGPPYDVQYPGAVDYSYSIGTYEITVVQYVAFLNAVAQSDPHELYNIAMAGGPGVMGGVFITRSGPDGNYTYTAVDGKENQPVRWVSCFDAMRFANWMHNGQGNGDTESGSYNLTLGDPTFVTREPGATWVVPTLDEWYKAAYYDPVNERYWMYPNGSDEEPPEPTDETSPRVFNFGGSPYWQGTVVFASTGDTIGQSPYGTFDQGGNAREWTETFSEPTIGQTRMQMGGYFGNPSSSFRASSFGGGATPDTDDGAAGFRLVYLIPEPSTVFLLLLGGPVLFMFKRRNR